MNDSLVYDCLLRIENLLVRLDSFVGFICESWFPLLLGFIGIVIIVSLLNWLVKL